MCVRECGTHIFEASGGASTHFSASWMALFLCGSVFAFFNSFSIVFLLLFGISLSKGQYALVPLVDLLCRSVSVSMFALVEKYGNIPQVTHRIYDYSIRKKNTRGQ